MMVKQRVLSACKKIPKGKVSTYKDIAKYIGKPKAFRAVGNTLNKNKDKSVPCYRVVLSSGDVGGFARGTNTKIKLLKKEGISICKGKIRDFKTVLFRFK